MQIYKIIQDGNVNSLISSVAEEIANEYVPLGAPFKNDFFWCQALLHKSHTHMVHDEIVDENMFAANVSVWP
jgi:hypothetical protein